MGFSPDSSGGLGASLDISEIEAATLVTEAETIAANDNDTTIATSAAVKDYADAATATLINKTFDADGTGNSVTNIDLTADVINDLPVTEGGAGRSSSTAFAVLCGGTTSTAAHQSIAALGSSGDVLTSNGAGALPTMQVAAGTTALEDAVDLSQQNGWVSAFVDTSDINTDITAATAGSGAIQYTNLQTRIGLIDTNAEGATIEGTLFTGSGGSGLDPHAWDLDCIMQGNAAFEPGTLCDAFWGLGTTIVGAGAVVVNSTSVVRHMGFYLEDTTLYVSNGDNTTQTKTDITSGITLTNYLTLRIVYEAGVDIKFYVNGVLEATHTTNLPSGTSSAHGLAIGMTSAGSAASTIMISRKVFIAMKM